MQIALVITYIVSFEALSLAFRVSDKFHRVMAIMCSCSEAVPVWVLALDDFSD